MANIVSAIVPLLNVSVLMIDEIICQILWIEFNSIVVDCISTKLCTMKVSSSARGKAQCSALQQESIATAHAVRHDHEEAWPSLVPQDVILCCLGDYYTGLQWSEPLTCAVCARHAESCLVVDLSETFKSTIWSCCRSRIPLSFNVALFSVYQQAFHFIMK